VGSPFLQNVGGIIQLFSIRSAKYAGGIQSKKFKEKSLQVWKKPSG